MAAVMTRLIRRDKGICHYCKCRTSKNSIPSVYPTRDHVVPRSVGGKNDLDNYVLACRRCNEKRGTSLFYCPCRDCQEKILFALYEPQSLYKMFDGVINHNKPKIKILPKQANKFEVRIGHNLKRFSNFRDAIQFANTGTFVKDRNYD